MAYTYGEFKNAESYIKDGHSYITSHEHIDDGYRSSESYINDGHSYITYHDHIDDGYKSSESYINEGTYASYGGPMIDYKKPVELIEEGTLTPQNITKEQQKLIHDDILLGVTNNKNLLAKKIDLIINNDDLVTSLLKTQYHLAVREMEKEYRGFYSEGVENRKFQFLTTVKMLVEKGYDIDKLNFDNNKKMPLARLLAEFKNNCSKYHAKSIPNASWFKEGKAPEGYDMKRTTNPYLFAGMLNTEIYVKNPKAFEEEHAKFIKNSNHPVNKNSSFEEFMLRIYGVKIPISFDYLNNFLEERQKQMSQDQLERNSNILNVMEQERSSGRGL